MRCRRWWVAVLLTLAAACGGGGGGDGDDSPPPDPNAPTRKGFGSVEITTPSSSSHSTESDSIHLGGTAFISPTNFVCCSGSADDTGVGVSWSSSRGGGGFTSQSVDLCFFIFTPFLCHHTWSAAVPLAVGANVIRVTAADSSGNVGTDTITVTRLPDSRPPTVMGTNPPNGAVGVPTNASLTAQFSEDVDASSVSLATFQVLHTNGTSAPGIVELIGRTAIFTPTVPLTSSTTYTATITGVKDLAGNAMAAPYSWTITTPVAAPIDTTPPTVLSTLPVNGLACTPTDSSATVTFSENLNALSVNTNSFTIKRPDQTSVNGAVEQVSGSIYRFRPLNALAFATTYSATVNAGVTDLAGNALGSNFTWTFTTLPGVNGAWQAIAPAGGFDYHTAVWTGTEMIIWGGFRGQFFSRDGLRYVPASNSALPITGIGAHPAGVGHAAVWTGTEMIVYGGGQANNLFNAKRYNPQLDAWTDVTTTNMPVPRSNASAVWTGTEMIIWGGGGLSQSNFGEPLGAAYNPATDSWRTLSTVNAPYLSGSQVSSREGHTAIWTGSLMLVWGGYSGFGPVIGEGAAYDPSTDTWEAIPTLGAPSARTYHSAVWTGTEMIVWGGTAGAVNSEGTLILGFGFNTGAAYNPQTKTWRPLSMTCPPAGKSGHTAIWTGSEMIIWGGQTGARYNPATDSWQHISPVGAPASRTRHTATWTGTDMIIWGGIDPSNVRLETAAKLHP